MLAVESHPNVPSNFIQKKFTVTHFTSLMHYHGNNRWSQQKIIIPLDEQQICTSKDQRNTRCGKKAMRLATLCTNRQYCCLPLHVAVRLTPAVDPLQV